MVSRASARRPASRARCRRRRASRLVSPFVLEVFSRDVLCRRGVAIGGQSYALATAMGASAYVGMRELVVRGVMRIPLLMRIGVAYTVTVLERIYVWYDDASDSFLRPWPPGDRRGAPPAGEGGGAAAADDGGEAAVHGRLVTFMRVVRRVVFGAGALVDNERRYPDRMIEQSFRRPARPGGARRSPLDAESGRQPEDHADGEYSWTDRGLPHCELPPGDGHALRGARDDSRGAEYKRSRTLDCR